MADRISRTCATCKVDDTHAHHVQYAALTHPVTGEAIDLSISKHIQCCAAGGCEVCATHIEFAPSAEIGDDFTAYIQAPSVEHELALSERHGVATPASIAAAEAAAAEGA